MTRGADDEDGSVCVALRVNEVKVPDDTDIRHVKRLLSDDNGWELVFSKNEVKVWRRPVKGCSFDMLRASISMPDVSAETAYDVLHDSEYRGVWDKYMTKSSDIGLINPNNDICYYAVSTVPPMRGRDFVMQRSWLDVGNEKLIFSHSVCHDKYPPSSDYIRATAFVTAYYIRQVGNGCHITYVTHSDPKGKIPAWFTNRLTKVVGPKIIKKLHKACQQYPEWKEKNRPHWKPWLHPEQQAGGPRIDMSECQPKMYNEDGELVDGSGTEAETSTDSD